MPNTRPGITFDNQGVCSACQAFERRKNIDWQQRFHELEELCNKYRGMNGNGPDCAIAVSGGKDSHYQVHLMKNIMKMNPILFTVDDNFPMTEAGAHNLKNICEEFGCNLISMKPDLKTQKNIMRYTFEKYGKPTWFFDRLLYTFPMHMAVQFHTPLLVYGENISYEYGGKDAVETYSASEQLNNGVASDIPFEELCSIKGVSEKDLYMLSAPTDEEMKQLDSMYVSYFVPWNSFKNYEFAKKHGFHDLTHEWKRMHTIENFDQVDSRGYLIHPWMKYPKFGHASATDYAARYIRYGLLTRDEAIKLVQEHDGKLDSLCVRDFCEFMGYSESEFWSVVDKFYNEELFTKNEFGEWVLKEPIQ